MYNQKLKDEFVDLVKYSLKTLLKFTFPIALIALIFTEIIINIFFGSEYLAASDAMRLIILALLATQLTFWVGPSLLAVGKPGLRTLLEIINSLFYVVLLLILVGNGYGLIGAGLALLIASIIKSLVAFYLFQKSVKTSF